LVAEEVAWLNAHYPGRVGLGVAIGALPLDFKIAGKELRHAVDSFKSELPQLVAMLRGEDLGELANDAALRLCATHPVPILSAAVSNAAAIRAARSGAGLLVEGMSDPERVAQLCDAYDNAGGTGSKVLIRRTWLGALPSELVDRQRAIYDSYSNSATAFGNDQTVTAESPTELIERLAAIVASTGVDALNLRVHLPGVAPQAAREQIEMLGSMVVTPLKKAWPG
jgi:alkanesulfonate monooxygenase SsuD/methylene tetrahydromethanopterin reductase-like flavin-dependent oxidoreductase (luciferase family)